MRGKVGLFNTFFANQFSLIKNTSVLPTNCESLADKSLSNITFIDNDIGKIIESFDPKSVHDHDMIGIRILKLCRGSIYKSLRPVFRACLDKRLSPCVGKKPTLPSFPSSDMRKIPWKVVV